MDMKKIQIELFIALMNRYNENSAEQRIRLAELERKFQEEEKRIAQANVAMKQAINKI